MRINICLPLCIAVFEGTKLGTSLQQLGNAKLSLLLISWTAKPQSYLHKEIKGCEKGIALISLPCTYFNPNSF